MVIPFSSEETSTAWSSSIGDYELGQCSTTQEQTSFLMSELEDGRVNTNQDMTDREFREFKVERYSLEFDKIAIVDKKHQDVINQMSELASNCGCDSSLYLACEMYNVFLVEIAEQVLPFYLTLNLKDV